MLADQNGLHIIWDKFWVLSTINKPLGYLLTGMLSSWRPLILWVWGPGRKIYRPWGRDRNVYERLICVVYHDGIIAWKSFPNYWPFVRGIHGWNPFRKGQSPCSIESQWFLCGQHDQLLNSRGGVDLGRHNAHVTPLCWLSDFPWLFLSRKYRRE